jgi:hypothetical protein
LYSGSLIITSFGNDITTGNAYPETYDIDYAIPIAGNCNTQPFHSQETLSLPNSTTPSYVFTIPQYGGAVNAVDTDSDTVFDVPVGCTYPSKGLPLVGSAIMVTSGDISVSQLPSNPRAIAMPASGIGMYHQGASFPRGVKYLWEVHYADLQNDDGVFNEGGGDGSFEVDHAGLGGKRSAHQTAGLHKFGGVMRLLGSYKSKEGYLSDAGTVWVGQFDWLFDYLGHGGQQTKNGEVTAGYPVNGQAPLNSRTFGATYMSTNYVELFKWTTGNVEVTAIQGAFATHLERNGYDNRDKYGVGVIQMVSPMLSHWAGPSASSTAAIGIMKLTVAPEPSSAAMLAVGAVGLGLLGYSQRRSRKR